MTARFASFCFLLVPVHFVGFAVWQPFLLFLRIICKPNILSCLLFFLFCSALFLNGCDGSAAPGEFLSSDWFLVSLLLN